MKSIRIITSLLIASFFYACSTSTGASKDDFLSIETQMKSEFGDNAYYSDLVITFDKVIGTSISKTVTDNPESLKMGEWSMSQGTWNQTAEITLELPKGTKATDFMFQLKDDLSLKLLGELAEKSKEKLKAEKEIENPVLTMAFVKFPDNGERSKANNVIKLEPETGGTSFSFFYDLNGKFIEMDY